ncbi:MAG: hypothetical protein GX287_03400 [Fusobacteria bacterium]|nr:hypothetical protein [Fusobacteriota bacterium]
MKNLTIKKLKINYISFIISVFIIFVICNIGIGIFHTYKRIKEQKKIELSYKNDIILLEYEKEEWERKLNNINVEKIAREKLNMVKKGERVYKLID